jgi:hypothetical protein
MNIPSAPFVIQGCRNRHKGRRLLTEISRLTLVSSLGNLRKQSVKAPQIMPDHNPYLDGPILRAWSN